MINKPSIHVYTPPVSIPRLRTRKAANVAASAGGGKTGTGGGSGAGGTQTEIPSLESLFAEMLKKYLPETVDFTPLDEATLSATIRNWLRPAYEQAIETRREQTGRINAELDADAWSRGMGQSTYLSDVKERQLESESRDVDLLESDYASALAGHLYDAMKEQQQMKIEVDQFNAEQINHAREQAMSAAQALYRTYLSQAGSYGGGRASSAADDPEDGGESVLKTLLKNRDDADIPKTDYQTAANMLARMKPAERARLYNRADPAYQALRSEILYSLGTKGFAKLMSAFPA